MARDIKPTRKNLMELEERIELAENGHETLEQKLDGLIMEFRDVLDQSRDVRQELADDYEHAQHMSDLVRAMDGEIAVRGAAASVENTPEIVVDSKNVMGVVAPRIESSDVTTELDKRGYGLLGTSGRIDELADAYEELLETIILAAEVETTMEKLLDEIKTTKRRVNALEHNLLPELREDREYIKQRLEEQRREQRFRMKLIKEKKLADTDGMESEVETSAETGIETEKEREQAGAALLSSTE